MRSPVRIWLSAPKRQHPRWGCCLFRDGRDSNWRPNRASAASGKGITVNLAQSARCAVPVRIWLSAPERAHPIWGCSVLIDVRFRTGDLTRGARYNKRAGRSPVRQFESGYQLQKEHTPLGCALSASTGRIELATSRAERGTINGQGAALSASSNLAISSKKAVAPPFFHFLSFSFSRRHATIEPTHSRERSP